MKRITYYQVVSSGNPDTVSGRVNLLLADGWEIYGPVRVTPLNRDCEYAAMYTVEMVRYVQMPPLPPQRQ